MTIDANLMTGFQFGLTPGFFLGSGLTLILLWPIMRGAQKQLDRARAALKDYWAAGFTGTTEVDCDRTFEKWYREEIER